MTERVVARHRADLRPSTPLSGLTSSLSFAVGDRAATLTRGGAVIAVSSGLVAAMGMPAQAATSASGDTTRTASVPLLPVVPLLDDSGASVSIGADLASAPVSASRRARVTFEHSAFTVARPSAARLSPGSASRQISTISRSLVRAAYGSARATTPAGHPSSGSRSVPTNGPTNGPTVGTPPSHTPAPVPAGNNSAAVAVAMRYLGIPYRYGGSSPRGFDCSGFTQYVFNLVGVSLPRTADQQLRASTRISRSQAVAGDLVFFFGGGGSVGHVGIYLGGGKMIDSPHTGTRVSIRSVYSATVAFGRV